MLDFEWIYREMAKSSVTLQLLWCEYAEKCRDAGEMPFQLTQFKKYYRDFALETKATMHINRKPGELMEVDWTRTTAAITDSITGNEFQMCVFVAALPYSGYAYTEAFRDMKIESWIAGHVNAYARQKISLRLRGWSATSVSLFSLQSVIRNFSALPR
jgi:transposase